MKPFFIYSRDLVDYSFFRFSYADTRRIRVVVKESVTLEGIEIGLKYKDSSNSQGVRKINKASKSERNH